MTPQIEQIILNKAFDELSKAELVLIYKEGISEAEYPHFRVILHSTTEVLADAPSASPRVEENLMKAFQAKHTKPSLGKHLKAIFTHRIPVWQLSAAASVLLLIANFFLPREIQIIQDPVEKIVYVNQTDTIYKEIEVPVNVAPGKAAQAPKQKVIFQKETNPLVIKSKPSKAVRIVNKPDEKERVAMQELLDQVEARNDFFSSAEQSKSEQVGRSATNDSSLMEFLVEMY